MIIKLKIVNLKSKIQTSQNGTVPPPKRCNSFPNRQIKQFSHLQIPILQKYPPLRSQNNPAPLFQICIPSVRMYPPPKRIPHPPLIRPPKYYKFT